LVLNWITTTSPLSASKEQKPPKLSGYATAQKAICGLRQRHADWHGTTPRPMSWPTLL